MPIDVAIVNGLEAGTIQLAAYSIEPPLIIQKREGVSDIRPDDNNPLVNQKLNNSTLVQL